VESRPVLNRGGTAKQRDAKRPRQWQWQS
jgi:hypothetical protein